MATKRKPAKRAHRAAPRTTPPAAVEPTPPPAPIESGPYCRPRTLTEVRAHIDRVRQLVEACMVEGKHYGPAAGSSSDRRNLLKPGAELVALAFGLVPEFTATAHALPCNHRDVQVVCHLREQSGSVVGQGVGSCSTLESRQRIDGEAPDAWNAVLKIAKKRAFVDAVLTACALSDLFAQDLDGMTPPPDAQRTGMAPRPAADHAATRAAAAARTTPTEAERAEDAARVANDEAKAEAVRLYAELGAIHHGTAAVAWLARAPTNSVRVEHLRAALAEVAKLRAAHGDQFAYEMLDEVARRSGYERDSGGRFTQPTKDAATTGLRELLNPTPDATTELPSY